MKTENPLPLIRQGVIFLPYLSNISLQTFVLLTSNNVRFFDRFFPNIRSLNFDFHFRDSEKSKK